MRIIIEVRPWEPYRVWLYGSSTLGPMAERMATEREYDTVEGLFEALNKLLASPAVFPPRAEKLYEALKA